MDDSKAKATEIRISMMIMTIVGLFVFCNAFQLLAFFMADKSGFYFGQYIAGLLAWFLACLNSSLNPVVYGIFNKKYKTRFLKYFCLKSSEEANETCSIPLTERTRLKTEL